MEKFSEIPEMYTKILSEKLKSENVDPKDFRKQLETFAQESMTMNQWKELTLNFELLSDEEAILWYLSYFDFPESQEDLERAIFLRMKQNDVTGETSASNLVHVNVADENDIRYITEMLSKSSPTEEFWLTYEDDSKYRSLWLQDNDDFSGIPSSLIFAKEVPVLDCNIYVDELTSAEPEIPFLNDFICKYRICIFENYKEIVDKNMKSRDVDIVGAIVAYQKEPHEWELIIPFGAQSRGNALMCNCAFSQGLDNSEIEIFSELPKGLIESIASEALTTWYGVQFALYGNIDVPKKKNKV